MKIIKIANEFEDEGRDSEEQIEELERFEGQQELDDKAIGKSGYTYTSKVLMSLRDKLGEPIQASWVSNGSVGWFEVDDIIYEVSVAPAAYGNYFDYFKDLLKRDRTPISEETEGTEETEETEDNLPM